MLGPIKMKPPSITPDVWQQAMERMQKQYNNKRTSMKVNKILGIVLACLFALYSIGGVIWLLWM